jgi:hypothetical protein
MTCDGRGERERDLMVFWVCFMVARERERERRGAIKFCLELQVTDVI